PSFAITFALGTIPADLSTIGRGLDAPHDSRSRYLKVATSAGYTIEPVLIPWQLFRCDGTSTQEEYGDDKRNESHHGRTIPVDDQQYRTTPAIPTPMRHHEIPASGGCCNEQPRRAGGTGSGAADLR